MLRSAFRKVYEHLAADHGEDEALYRDDWERFTGSQEAREALALFTRALEADVLTPEGIQPGLERVRRWFLRELIEEVIDEELQAGRVACVPQVRADGSVEILYGKRNRHGPGKSACGLQEN